MTGRTTSMVLPYGVEKACRRGIRRIVEMVRSEDDYDPAQPIHVEMEVDGRPVMLMIGAPSDEARRARGGAG